MDGMDQKDRRSGNAGDGGVLLRVDRAGDVRKGLQGWKGQQGRKGWKGWKGQKKRSVGLEGSAGSAGFFRKGSSVRFASGWATLAMLCLAGLSQPAHAQDEQIGLAVGAKPPANIQVENLDGQ